MRSETVLVIWRSDRKWGFNGHNTYSHYVQHGKTHVAGENGLPMCGSKTRCNYKMELSSKKLPNCLNCLRKLPIDWHTVLIKKEEGIKAVEAQKVAEAQAEANRLELAALKKQVAEITAKQKREEELAELKRKREYDEWADKHLAKRYEDSMAYAREQREERERDEYDAGWAGVLRRKG